MGRWGTCSEVRADVLIVFAGARSPRRQFYEVVLAVHIMASCLSLRRDLRLSDPAHRRPRPTRAACRLLHRVEHSIERMLVNPGLAVACSAASISPARPSLERVLRAVGSRRRGRDRRRRGRLTIPPPERADQVADGTSRPGAGEGPSAFSNEHDSLVRRIATIGALMSLLVLVTILFMATQTGPDPSSGALRRYPDGMSNGYRVAVVGATGQVGTLMLELLRERAFPAREIVPFASERSVGRELEGGLVVQGLDEESIQGFDLALFSAGRLHLGGVGSAVRRAGAVVIDNSSRWRMQRRRATGRQRGQPRRARRPPRDRRQPQLLDDADGSRAEAAPRGGAGSSGW